MNGVVNDDDDDDDDNDDIRNSRRACFQSCHGIQG